MRPHSQVRHCSKRFLAVFVITYEADRLNANAWLFVAVLLAIKEEFDGAFAVVVEVVAYDDYVVPAFLLLSEIEPSRHNSVRFFANGLQLAHILIDLDVGTFPVNVLYENMLLFSIVEVQWQNHPETDGPLLHDHARKSEASWNHDDVIEVEEGAPVPVQATPDRQSERLALLDQ